MNPFRIYTDVLRYTLSTTSMYSYSMRTSLSQSSLSLSIGYDLAMNLCSIFRPLASDLTSTVLRTELKLSPLLAPPLTWERQRQRELVLEIKYGYD